MLRVPFLATQAGAFPKKFKKSSKKIQKIKNVILASFLAKWGYDRLKRRKKKIILGTVSANLGWSIPKKKKLKKLQKLKNLKNVFLTSFLVKSGRDSWKRKKKSFRVPFRPDSGWSIPKNFNKNSKKNQKIKKRHSDFISSQTEVGQAKKEKNKFRSRYHFYLTRVGVFQKILKKNVKKFQKKKKESFWLHFKPNWARTSRKRE